MTDSTIAADQDELAKGVAGAGLFEEPKEPFDGDVDNIVGSFFAGGTVDDVGNAGHGAADYVAIGDIAGDDLGAIVGIERAVVAEGANGNVAEVVVTEDATNEVGANFSGRAGDENAFHETFLF